jgi:uncharacterized protein (TIGR02680 family)
MSAMRSPDRFVPVRAGIVNLYEYDDQTFELADGRLLLRGHNTSGKTKALELLFPFCLDGDISPRKLDPFAKNAKEMKWNLVGCVDHDQRIGYVWTEFARLGSDGLEHVTGGIGMKANRGSEGVKRWYFLLRGRRIGHDLSLRRGDYPLTRRELADELADVDELVDTPRDYRLLLNEAVFGFPSIEQYETMLTLLLELRRPHLSKALNAADVATFLSDALPEVDHDLMRRVGEGLEQLDDLQAALRTVEEVRERVKQFTKSSYRDYARAAIADRGTRLRAAAREHGKASEALRSATAGLSAAREHAQLQAQALSSTKQGLQVAEGERDALLQSAEWATVAEIEQLGRAAGHARVAADQARDRAEDAAARVAADEADTIAAAAVAELDRKVFQEALGALAADARAAGIAARHEALVPGLVEPSRGSTVTELLGEEAARWLEVLVEHEGLLDTVAAAQARSRQACEERDTARDAVRAAGDVRAGFAQELADAREALIEAIEAWTGELVELRLDETVLAGTLELVGGLSRQDAWRDVLAEQRDALVAERTTLVASRGGLAQECRELDEVRAAVASEEDAPPPALYTRPADRGVRAGAPLWRLVDFVPSVDSDTRMGIEAALEGAGLLDAWVMPDGEVRNADSLDVLLNAGAPPTEGASLTLVLMAGDGGSVPASVVERILGSIGLVEGEGELPAHACVINSDGRFRLGPAHGHFSKQAAEYIGTSARAARRERRLAELGDELDAMVKRQADAEQAVGRADGRLAALASDAERFPDIEPFTEARGRLTNAEEREADARGAVSGREAEVARAAERHAQGVDAVAAHARACQLPADLEAAGVRARTAAVHRYRAALPSTLRAAVRSVESDDRLVELNQRVEEARAVVGGLVEAFELADAEARRVAAEYAEREATLGGTATEARARKHEVDKRLKVLRAEDERLQAASTQAAVDAQKCESAEDAAKLVLEAASGERESSLAAFRRLEESDMFVIALGGDAPPDHADAGSWVLTRALEVMRAIPAERLVVRSTLVSLSNQVQQRCGELDRGLGQLAEMGVVPESDSDGLLVVRVRRGAELVTLSELQARLDEEIAERERALSAEQRRVFGDALLDEIAEHLRVKIERVNGLVADMNATLAGCQTGSGRTVQLEWAAREDDELRAVTRLLRRSVATLGDAEREPLIAFFRDRIQQVREEAAPGTAGAPAGTAAHLRAAFDYRAWFEFTLYEVQAGQRIKLTRKRHAVGSGGEQAVLIHMPLLASAAALYSSSRDGRAPRLVILDEALSGIDDATRERVFAVLVALDLDVVMTSHELWGTYRTVPSLSIYQLHRENGVFGVASEHFLWDGETLRELEQATLLG